jgi:thiol-disulfide isomerase/thioredoxin
MVRRALASAVVLAALAIVPEAISAPAPDCSLRLLPSGTPLNLSQYRGKVLYLDFWASWCGPCQLSFPFMNRLNKDYGGRGLAVVAVNLDARSNDARSFLARHSAQFAVAMGDNQQCAKRFALNAMPTSYLIDRSGTLRASHSGFRPEKARAVRAEIERLLSEGPNT